VNELETQVRSQLDRLVPMPDGSDASWADAVRRGERGSRDRARRGLQLAAALAGAAALVLALTPLGGAIGRGIGDFSAWLSGQPGEPASQSEQAEFEQANKRAWGGFPEGTHLRRLITARAGGGTFELFGFRSGDSLCLRLTVTGIATKKSGPLPTSCAPLDELRAARAPVLVVGTDYGVGSQAVEPTSEGYIPPQVSVTLGIVADGVERVELVSNHGRAGAIIEDNAFLSLVDRPPLGLRTREAVVTTSDGQSLGVLIAESPFGDFWPAARPGVAPGPTAVERKVEGGTIGWIARRELRGQSLEEAGLTGRLGGRKADFVRVVKPDPAGYLRVTVGVRGTDPDAAICSYLVQINGAGGGCFAPRDAFERKPFTVGTSVEYGGDQYALVSGLATDDVARMELYLATGERRAVPLNDNAYVASVPRTMYPARLVAYDEAGRVIGIEAMSHDPLTWTGPRPVEGEQRVVLTVTGPNGTQGRLLVGPSTDGGRCWKVTFDGGGGGSGCPPKTARMPVLALAVQDGGRDNFVTGEVAAGVTRIELRFASGRTADVKPVETFVLFPIPSGEEVASATGYDAAGRELGRVRLRG
jgi:hypothetical protein